MVFDKRTLTILSNVSKENIIKQMDDCKKNMDIEYYNYLMMLLPNVITAKILTGKQ